MEQSQRFSDALADLRDFVSGAHGDPYSLRRSTAHGESRNFFWMEYDSVIRSMERTSGVTSWWQWQSTICCDFRRTNANGWKLNTTSSCIGGTCVSLLRN